MSWRIDGLSARPGFPEGLVTHNSARGDCAGNPGRYHRPMAIRVYPLRQRGRRLPRHAAAVAEGRVGSISLHTELRGTESYTAVTLRSGRPKEPELLPPL